MNPSTKKRNGEVGFKIVFKRGKHVSFKGEMHNVGDCIAMSHQFDARDKFSEQQIKAASSPGSSKQVRKPKESPIVVSIFEFGGFQKETLNSFQIAQKVD